MICVDWGGSDQLRSAPTSVLMPCLAVALSVQVVQHGSGEGRRRHGGGNPGDRHG